METSADVSEPNVSTRIHSIQRFLLVLLVKCTALVIVVMFGPFARLFGATCDFIEYLLSPFLYIIDLFCLCFLVVFVLILMVRQPVEKAKEYKIASQSSKTHKWKINDIPLTYVKTPK